MGLDALAGTWLLFRRGLIGVRKDRFGQMRSFVSGLDQGSADVWQGGGLDVCLPNSKCGSQIAKSASPPIADIRLPDAGELLQKLKHRGVIEGLTANPSAGGPRGNDDAGHAEPTAYGRRRSQTREAYPPEARVVAHDRRCRRSRRS